MGRYCVKVLAAAVFFFSLAVHSTSARSFQHQQDADDEDDAGDFERRQFGGGYFYLPPWLERIRDLPSLLAPKQQPTGDSRPTATKKNKPVEVLNWPSIDLDVGQITGVAVDESANPVILHRGNVKWTGSSFDGARRYVNAGDGPIKNDTIVTLDARTGNLVDHWGSNLFYMPHGLEIDAQGNVWVTDVALHQVFKFPKGSRVPSLTLGEAFVTGSDESHFCQPTDVAVASSGVFFVADGYCNQRILKYDPSGKLLATYKGSFNVPHSLALFEEQNALCVADRENGRVVCISAGLGEGQQPSFGTPYGPTNGKKIGQVYAVAPKGNDVYAVLGSIFLGKAEGKTLSLDNLQVETSWARSGGFGSPHDVAISKDGEAMYVVEIGPNKITKFALE